MKNFLTIFLLILLSIFTNVSQAEVKNNNKTIHILLSQIAPNKNAESIIERKDQLSSVVKKISFPKNDKSLLNLTGYSFEAYKNQDFNQTYQALLNNLPQVLHEKNRWLDDLKNLTSVPIEYWSTPNENLLSLSFCVPHDCTTNVLLLYNPKTKTLWGILHEDNGQSFLLGNPTNDQIALLLIVIGDNIILY